MQKKISGWFEKMKIRKIDGVPLLELSKIQIKKLNDILIMLDDSQKPKSFVYNLSITLSEMDAMSNAKN